MVPGIPFPIPTVGGETRETPTEYPGAPHAERAANALVGSNGVVEMAVFAEHCLQDLARKAHDAQKSEADLAELQETRLDILQALRHIQRLVQEAEQEMELAAAGAE